MAAALTTNLTDIFSCPISYGILSDPVMDPCGHTFERVMIVEWLREHNHCPLSRRPITTASLVPNLILRQALEILAHHTEALSDQSGLSAEDREVVSLATSHINHQRTQNEANGIPSRVPEPPSFVERIKTTMSATALKSKEACMQSLNVFSGEN